MIEEIREELSLFGYRLCEDDLQAASEYVMEYGADISEYVEDLIENYVDYGIMLEKI